jgi:hypothetical protein
MNAPQPFKYPAFISYSYSDEEWAKGLHMTLETYRMSKRLARNEAERQRRGKPDAVQKLRSGKG